MVPTLPLKDHAGFIFPSGLSLNIQLVKLSTCCESFQEFSGGVGPSIHSVNSLYATLATPPGVVSWHVLMTRVRKATASGVF